MSNQSVSSIKSERKIHNVSSQGSRFVIAAFLLLTAILPMMGCEGTPGSIGGGINNNTETVETRTVEVTGLEAVTSSTYSGRLQNSAMGYVEDPAYGALNAVALLKPEIIKSQVDSIGPDDVLKLKFVFNTADYGITTTVSDFEIFEVDERWRGNELRYNSTIAADLASKVGEFQVGEEDTVEVELSNEWKQKYLEIYDAPDADRDSLYQSDFNGLAVVPSTSNQRLHFIKHQQSLDDENNPIVGSATSMLVVSPDEEVGTRTFTMRDWGTSMTRENEPDHGNTLVLHNNERYMKMTLDLPEDLEGENIVNVQLILSPDPDAVVNGFSRPQTESIRGHVSSSEPTDLGSELFLTEIAFGGLLEEDKDVFRLNLTNYVLNVVYGGGENLPIYLSPQAINGLIYTTEIEGTDTVEDRRPRLVITIAKSES
ncbi:MAG: hypothetical protein WD735_06600 [Balneolaceae bacterium]